MRQDGLDVFFDSDGVNFEWAADIRWFNVFSLKLGAVRLRETGKIIGDE